MDIVSKHKYFGLAPTSKGESGGYFTPIHFRILRGDTNMTTQHDITYLLQPHAGNWNPNNHDDTSDNLQIASYWEVYDTDWWLHWDTHQEPLFYRSIDPDQEKYLDEPLKMYLKNTTNWSYWDQTNITPPTGHIVSSSSPNGPWFIRGSWDTTEVTTIDLSQHIYFGFAPTSWAGSGNFLPMQFRIHNESHSNLTTSPNITYLLSPLPGYDKSADDLNDHYHHAHYPHPIQTGPDWPNHWANHQEPIYYRTIDSWQTSNLSDGSYLYMRFRNGYHWLSDLVMPPTGHVVSASSPNGPWVIRGTWDTSTISWHGGENGETWKEFDLPLIIDPDKIIDPDTSPKASFHMGTSWDEVITPLTPLTELNYEKLTIPTPVAQASAEEEPEGPDEPETQAAQAAAPEGTQLDTTSMTTPNPSKTEREATIDPSDQDSKSGKCTSNDMNCYLNIDYWQDMSAEAEGPLVSLIKTLPTDIRRLFSHDKEVIESSDEISGLEWVKVDKVDTSQYLEIDHSKFEEEMKQLINNSSSDTEVVFSKDKFDEIALEDKIKEKSLVILDNGDMYIPKQTFSDRISIETTITVKNIVILIIVLVTTFVLIIGIVKRLLSHTPTPKSPYRPPHWNSPYRLPPWKR